MNLSKLFKFLNKSKENSNTTLASFKDLYQIPSIKDIKDSYLLEKIKNYQKNYWQIIHSKKTLTSLDFELDNTTKTMNMYIDLLLNTLLEEKSSLYKSSEEKFSLSDALKMQMYLFDLNDLYIENLCRLIALNEIAIKAKFFISKNKLNALNEAIYTLIISQNNFETNKLAIKIKIENYLTTVEQENSKLIKEEILEHIIYLAKNIIPDTTNKILNENYPPATTKALIERALEIYAYQNQHLVNNLRKEVVELNIPFYFEALKTLNRLKILEIIYEVFDRFGHNLISQEELEYFYTKKFHVLTTSSLNIKDSIISENSPKIEKEVYKNLIKNLLNKKLNYYTKSNYLLYRIMSKIFKNGKNYYDYEEILKTPLLLAFLTYSVDYYYFFHNYLINTKDYPDLNFFKDIMAWEESVPLITFLKIMELNNRQSLFYTFYKQMLKGKYQYTYKLPNGLTHINLNADIYNNSGIITNIIKKNVANKKLIFPYSLKSYCGPIFSSITKGCILNEGLEYLYLNEHEEISELVIPSSLKVLTNTDNRPLKINTIIFNNYKNSALLNNKDALTNLLKHIISYEPIETKYHFETNNGKIDMNKPYYEFLFKLKCKFEKIVLIDKKNREHFIYPKDLDFCYSFTTKDLEKKTDCYEYYVIIANKIYEIIRNYNKKNKNPKRTKRQL